jgi:hypothetical protein
VTKSMNMALNGDENNVPKSVRDDLVQPMNRGKMSFRKKNALPVLQSLQLRGISGQL